MLVGLVPLTALMLVIAATYWIAGGATDREGPVRSPPVAVSPATSLPPISSVADGQPSPIVSDGAKPPGPT